MDGRLNHPFFTQEDEELDLCGDPECDGALIYDEPLDLWCCNKCPYSEDPDGRVFVREAV